MSTVGSVTGSVVQDVLAEGFGDAPAPPAGPTLLLDTLSANAAWSFSRKLSTAYSGSAFRLRRDSDDAEQDIGFDSFDIDTASITSFVGANNGYVVRVYDQTTNSRDLSQSTPGTQPIMVVAGTLLTDNGVPKCRFTTDTWLERADSCGLSGNPGWTMGILASLDSAVATEAFFGLGDGGGGTQFSAWGDCSHRFFNGNEVFADAAPRNQMFHMLSTLPSGGAYDSGQLFLDGTESSSVSSNTANGPLNLSNTLTVMGGMYSGAAIDWLLQSEFMEWILFEDALSAGNRSSLMTEQLAVAGI